jgi:acetyl/propionyl-CoA carboxylase alpha subunit
VSSRLIIANRGEIARRVLRAGRERGYRVAVISTPADRDSLVRREADDVLEVGSFLDGEAIVRAAREWRADLLHPGYGFLSENAPFARRVEEAGIRFVGPTPQDMERLGDKESAKALAAACGVPTLAILGSQEIGEIPPDRWENELASRGVRPPYLIKASGGGGGRGMRRVGAPAALPDAIRRASDEARQGFGDPGVFIERYLPSPRHIEIQVFGDGRGGGVFLGERECSLQRRHQKVLEEAPSPVVDGPLRRAMGRAALSLVAATGYRGAGTVEFLLDRDKSFYFLEVNARLQVEHPVTEMVYGIDLVQAQLDLAEGRWPERLGDPDRFAVPEPNGVAIEARVLAEDPRRDFVPTPGPLLLYREPAGEGIRVDSGVIEGGRIHPDFDSLIAKVIAHGPTRDAAAARLESALESMIVQGPVTNLPFLQAILRHPEFRAGVQSTHWLEEQRAGLSGPLLPEALQALLRSRGFRERLAAALGSGAAARPAPIAGRFASQWDDAFRIGSTFELPPIGISPVEGAREFVLTGPGCREALRQADLESYRYSSSLREAAARAAQPGQEPRLVFQASPVSPSRMAVSLFGETLHLDHPAHTAPSEEATGSAGAEVRAPMAGKVLEIGVSEGDEVGEGQVVFVVESMKMQLEVRAPASGRIAKVHVLPGQVLNGPDVLATLA